MTTYNTGNPIGPNGSPAAEDLYDNSENLDFWVLTQEEWQWPDRLGVSRWTWYGMEQQFLQNEASREERFNELLANTGYDFIGDYAPTAGIVVTEYNQVLRDTAGALWRLDTATPIPYTTDGSGMDEGGAFRAIDQDQGLRTDLADPAQGGDLVSVTSATGEQTLDVAISRRNIWTSSIVGLRNLDITNTSGGQKATITRSGRAGDFVWDPANRSVQVTADPLQGIYVPPNSDPTGASGAWIRLDPVLTPEMYDVVGDGVNDDTAGLIQFFSNGKPGRCNPTANYLFTERMLFDKPGVALFTNGATFTYGGAASAASVIQVQGAATSWTIDRLNIHIASGSAVDKVIDIYGQDFHCSHMKITSDDQQNNRNSTVDAAFRVLGDDVTVDWLEIDKFDNGVRWRGANGSLPKLDLTSYVRGVWLDETPGLTFGTWNIGTAAPNASMTPGHNGVLCDDATDISGREIRVEDSGEHGVRISGQTTGCKRLNIERIITRNTGGTGVKWRCNSGSTNDDINIGTITCEDCGDAANPITNQEGLLIERVRRLWIGHYSVRRRNKTTSCHNAIAFTDAQVVQIDSVRIENCNREAVYFTTVDQDDGGNTVYVDCNDIQIGGGMVLNPGRHVIFADMDTGDLRNIDITLKARSIGEGNAALIAFSANAGIIASNSTFKLDWTTAGSPTAGAVRGSGINANVIVEAIGDNFNAGAATPKAGSTWLNTANGNRLIRTAAGDWVSII